MKGTVIVSNLLTMPSVPIQIDFRWLLRIEHFSFSYYRVVKKGYPEYLQE